MVKNSIVACLKITIRSLYTYCRKGDPRKNYRDRETMVDQPRGIERKSFYKLKLPFLKPKPTLGPTLGDGLAKAVAEGWAERIHGPVLDQSTSSGVRLDSTTRFYPEEVTGSCKTAN